MAVGLCLGTPLSVDGSVPKPGTLPSTCSVERHHSLASACPFPPRFRVYTCYVLKGMESMEIHRNLLGTIGMLQTFPLGD